MIWRLWFHPSWGRATLRSRTGRASLAVISKKGEHWIWQNLSMDLWIGFCCAAFCCAESLVYSSASAGFWADCWAHICSTAFGSSCSFFWRFLFCHSLLFPSWQTRPAFLRKSHLPFPDCRKPRLILQWSLPLSGWKILPSLLAKAHQRFFGSSFLSFGLPEPYSPPFRDPVSTKTAYSPFFGSSSPASKSQRTFQVLPGHPAYYKDQWPCTVLPFYGRL